MLQAYARNLYGPQILGQLSLVLIKLGTGAGQLALLAGSSPEVTVATPGGGVYNLTFPPGVTGFVFDPCPVASPGTAPGDKLTVTAFSASAGTLSLTKSDTTDLTGAEQIHLALLMGDL